MIAYLPEQWVLRVVGYAVTGHSARLGVGTSTRQRRSVNQPRLQPPDGSLTRRVMLRGYDIGLQHELLRHYGNETDGTRSGRTTRLVRRRGVK